MPRGVSRHAVSSRLVAAVGLLAVVSMPLMIAAIYPVAYLVRHKTPASYATVGAAVLRVANSCTAEIEEKFRFD